MVDKDNKFKTVGDALAFCRQFGLDISATNEQLFDVANSLLVANRRPQLISHENRDFRGFKIKPSDRGMSYFMSDEDTTFNGVTDRFSFIVIAKDLKEANLFADHALHPAKFEWE
jgi:hypothetical protein